MVVSSQPPAPAELPLASNLPALLRQYWGYDSFRPLQERIIHSLLGGHDACVVMPTGGGKSLCYQLPALVLGKTVIVISPLIALMQDQAAQLAQMGIPAAVLNSSLSHAQQSAVMRKARAGDYRLLYLSPERLAAENAVEWLRQVPVAFFAIDEAHCISEWGHEFRPEYRQLSRLRQHFPDAPIAAFTASATQRVRHDILQQLQLHQPHKYIISFHRANLRYVARECKGEEQSRLLVRALEHYDGSNVIVYSPTIARVEETVDFLESKGIAAIPYHGKMDNASRRKNQERWMSDEVRVLVGTIAFGLGINKSAVRAVLHLSLPKSIEQYYQEAGRAGRDGEPADCVMLWQKKDVGLLAYFADQIEDAAEKQRAWKRYDEIRQFAESTRCRHRQVCLHFGETPKWEKCDACDICGYQVEWLRPRSSDSLKEPGRAPATFGSSTRRVAASGSTASGVGDFKPSAGDLDPDLREYLRDWRRALAKEQNVPAFLVMYDNSLEEICRIRPQTLADVRQIYGFGERKTEIYGPQVLAALAKFKDGARAAEMKTKRTAPAQETLQLLAEGRTLDQIAEIRGRQLTTVVNQVAVMVERGDVAFHPDWVSEDKLRLVEAACGQLGTQWLKPLKEVLPPEVSFDDVRLVVAKLRREQAEGK